MSIKSNNYITLKLTPTVTQTLTLNIDLRLKVEHRKQADDIQVIFTANKGDCALFSVNIYRK